MGSCRKGSATTEQVYGRLMRQSLPSRHTARTAGGALGTCSGANASSGPARVIMVVVEEDEEAGNGV